MVTAEILSGILTHLTRLLADGQSPRSISDQFEKIAVSLSMENIQIEKMDCKEYYDDGDLSLILLMKNEALANAQFEQASKFRFIEKELLQEKGVNESTKLKTEPSFFEYDNTRIIFHYNKRKENQRLIANLIEGYILIRQKSICNKVFAC